MDIEEEEEEEEEESHLDLSTSTSRKVRMSYFLISSEKTGVMSRHGPHQVAVKSTTICGQKFVIFLCLRTRCKNKMRRRQWLLLLLLLLLLLHHLLFFFFFFFFSPQVCFLARRHTQKQGVL
jgi:cell division protein FtsW (lipid II flippase)